MLIRYLNTPPAIAEDYRRMIADLRQDGHPHMSAKMLEYTIRDFSVQEQKYRALGRDHEDCYLPEYESHFGDPA